MVRFVILWIPTKLLVRPSSLPALIVYMRSFLVFLVTLPTLLTLPLPESITTAHYRRPRRLGLAELSGQRAAAELAAAGVREETAAVDRFGEDVDALLAACAPCPRTPRPHQSARSRAAAARTSALVGRRAVRGSQARRWHGIASQSLVTAGSRRRHGDDERWRSWG